MFCLAWGLCISDAYVKLVCFAVLHIADGASGLDRVSSTITSTIIYIQVTIGIIDLISKYKPLKLYSAVPCTQLIAVLPTLQQHNP